MAEDGIIFIVFILFIVLTFFIIQYHLLQIKYEKYNEYFKNKKNIYVPNLQELINENTFTFYKFLRNFIYEYKQKADSRVLQISGRKAKEFYREKIFSKGD